MPSRPSKRSPEQSEISPELFGPPPPRPWQPHAYQRRAIKFLLEHAAAALFLDPGLGKTSVVMAALLVLWKRLGRRRRGKTLVIAPLRVCHLVWPKEREKWTDFAGLRISVLHGPRKEEALSAEADVYVINPDGLPWLLGAEGARGGTGRWSVTIDRKRWKALGFDHLVVDELSKFKHPNTRRYKALKHVLPTFGRRWGLTGSPAANGLMDLFGQCFVLDLGKALGEFITHYRSCYFERSWDGHSWDLNEGADAKIFSRVKPLALRMGKEELEGAPEVIESDVLVKLPPEAEAVYRPLDRDLIASVRGHVVTAANAAVASMKCRQVASGAVYVDDDPGRGGRRRWEEVHEAKLDALTDLIDELQGQTLLVAYEFEHDLQRILTRLGRRTPYIGGGVSTRRAAEIEAGWNGGKIPVLLGHPKSMAHGLNLQAGGYHVCWFTLTWNFEEYGQLNDRLARQGGSARVFVHRLIAAGTVDVDVAAALRAKERGQRALFDALSRRARTR